jgi:predicted transcriptional regulator
MTSELRIKSHSYLLGRKRSDIDIIANVLIEATNCTKKTHILNRFNLSHRQLQVYLQFLHDAGFLVSYSNNEGSKMKYFRTT